MYSAFAAALVYALLGRDAWFNCIDHSLEAFLRSSDCPMTSARTSARVLLLTNGVLSMVMSSA